MSWTRCTAEQKAACSFIIQGGECQGANQHHAQYPVTRFVGRIATQWREASFNKDQTPLCIHRAIHSSGYEPEPVDVATMKAELAGADTARALSERARQLAIGQAIMQGETGYFGDAA